MFSISVYEQFFPTGWTVEVAAINYGHVEQGSLYVFVAELLPFKFVVTPCLSRDSYPMRTGA